MPSIFQNVRNLFPRAAAGPYGDAGIPGFAVYGGYLATAERNSQLTGQARYAKASDMLANISIIAASVRFFLNLLAKPDWTFDPADDSAEAQAMADFMQECIDDCQTNFTRIVRRGGMYRFHGFAFQEWIAKKRDDGKIGIDDIKQRPQHTINRWDIDERGNLIGVEQVATQNGQRFYVPRRKLIYLVDDTMTDAPDGMGWFRHLVEPSDRLAEYLSHEGMGFLRDLSGIPVAKAPLAELAGKIGQPKPGPGGGAYTAADIQSSLSGLREFISMKVRQPNTSILLDSAVYKDSTDTGQKSASTPKYSMDLLTGKTESLPEVAKAIERLAYDMARIMGTEVLLTGSEGKGSLALSTNQSQNLYLTVNSTLVDMGEAFDRDLTVPIWALNGFDEKLKPKARPGEVLFRDVEAAAAVLADMASAGAQLAPDDPAIDELRALLGLSPQLEMTPERMQILADLNRPPAPEAAPGSDDDDDPSLDPENDKKGKPPAKK